MTSSEREDSPDEQTDYLTDDEAWAVVHHLGFHLRDAGLLSSAIARSRTTVFGEDAYPDLPTKAAALFESLVRNRPLPDGNKRLAVVLTWTFLLNNGRPRCGRARRRGWFSARMLREPS